MMLEGMDFRMTQLACDEETARILSMISSRASSIKEISGTLSIPVAKCYRRLHEMEEKRLVTRDRDGRTETYRSNLRSLKVMIEGDRLYQEVEFADGRRRTFEFDGSILGEQEALQTGT